jgi:peptidyl-dipeptidase A
MGLRSTRAPALAAFVALALGQGAAPAAEQRLPQRGMAEEAAAFVTEAEARFLDAAIRSERASWVQQNFITEDTEILASEAEQALIATTVEVARQAARFDGAQLPDDLARKLKLLKLALSKPAPSDPDKQAELTRTTAGMQSRYGTGKYCRGGDPSRCLNLEELTKTMATSRDPEELREIWAGWHEVGRPMRNDYRRFVELANEGARELGFADLGVMWRSRYDMTPEAFAAEVDRLWGQVRPLYEALHCHVRARLAERYGPDVVSPTGPIPAHLLGNMWAQQWNNIYDLVAPREGDPGYDLTELLGRKGVDAHEMVRYGERFFSSLGFEPLPASFWDRSLFVKPPDREVVCHASAWDIDFESDLRIKMCIDVTAEDFVTIHHELGHNYYQRAYNRQPPLYRDSANDGFHEGLGDTVALSITPEYLVRIGLLERAPGAEGDIGLLLRLALDKIAFLPFGLLIDQWRWKVFSGEFPPENYNRAWWELRRKYQGVAPAVPRSEAEFDPGAKYHIPFNTPYTRYFLAHILQFQLHRALCQAAGSAGPLHRCSIHGSAAAGEKLRGMMELGMSRPWPVALEAVTGQRQLDASAILDYFAPLKRWLDAQNQGRACGW